MPLELVTHLRVHVLEHARLRSIADKPGQRPIDTHFEMVRLFVVDELDMLLGVAHQRSPELRRGTTSSANSCNVDRLTRSCKKNTKKVTPLSTASSKRGTTVSGVPTCSVACNPHASAPKRRSASLATSGTSASAAARASTDSVDSRIVEASRPLRVHASRSTAILSSRSAREYVGQFHQSP